MTSIASSAYSTEVPTYEFLQIDSPYEIVTHGALKKSLEYERAFNTIDKWKEINSGHHNEKRTQTRFEFRDNIIVAFFMSQQGNFRIDQKMVSLEVPCKDVSLGGVSFLCAKEIVAIDPMDTSGILDLNRILLPDSELAVGMRPNGHEWIWMHARTCRVRKTQEDIYEIGVHFKEKLLTKAK